jgi:hypothetical protein
MLANPECYYKISNSKNSSNVDIVALGRVMITLMEKVVPDDDDFKLESTESWSTEADNFLSQTKTAISPQNLATVSHNQLIRALSISNYSSIRFSKGPNKRKSLWS